MMPIERSDHITEKLAKKIIKERSIASMRVRPIVREVYTIE